MFDSNDDNLWEVPSIDVNAPVQVAVSAEEAVLAPEAETAAEAVAMGLADAVIDQVPIQASAELAHTSYQRVQSLYDQGLVSAQKRDEAHTQWRANAAQANGFEGLPFFIGAVIIAHQLGAPQARLDQLACAFIVLRLAYIALYVGDKAMARSLVWGLGLAVNIAILLLGWR